MSFDPNDMEERRQQYRESMLGVNRPVKASKRAERMVYGLISQALTAHTRPSPHHEAVLKDRTKALMRHIGRLELVQEEAETVEEVVEAARKYHDLPDEVNANVLYLALQRLKEYREHQEDRRG